MTDDYIREGDIVEIDYITEFTKEHINEGKALVIWKGFNNQPLVRKLDTKATIWACYEHIARVVGHIDIVGYMDRALSAEPCEDCISRQEALNVVHRYFEHYLQLNDDICLDGLRSLPSITPKEKTGHWILQPSNKEQGERDFIWWKCSECGQVIFSETKKDRREYHAYCGRCGARMVSE